MRSGRFRDGRWGFDAEHWGETGDVHYTRDASGDAGEMELRVLLVAMSRISTKRARPPEPKKITSLKSSTRVWGLLLQLLHEASTQTRHLTMSISPANSTVSMVERLPHRGGHAPVPLISNVRRPSRATLCVPRHSSEQLV